MIANPTTSQILEQQKSSRTQKQTLLLFEYQLLVFLHGGFFNFLHTRQVLVLCTFLKLSYQSLVLVLGSRLVFALYGIMHV